MRWISINSYTHSFTFLSECTCSGDDYASRFLIENGADVNIALPESRLTPLHLAVLQSRDLPPTNHMSSIIELLLQKAADANAQDSNSRLVCVKCLKASVLSCEYYHIKITLETRQRVQTLPMLSCPVYSLQSPS